MPLLVRILAIGSCAVAGYFVASLSSSPSPELTIQPVASAPSSPSRPTHILPPSATLSLVSDWEKISRVNAGFPDHYATLKESKTTLSRTAYLSALIAQWTSQDPHGAWEYLQENDSASLGQLIREWLRNDPQAAIKHLLAGDEKRRGRLRSFLGEIARVAPSRLAEVVAALPKSTNRWDTTTQDAFDTLAQQDPEAARNTALAVRGPLRGQALAGVAKAWAQSDGPSALAWAQDLPAGEERDAALKGVLTGWAKTDPVAALERIDLVPPGGEEMYHASDVGAMVLREAAKRDWRGTVEWLRNNPGKLGRSSLDGLQSTLSQRLRMDPAGTMQSLADSGVPGLGMVFGNSVLNEGYAQRDTIWEWLDGQPESDFTRGARGSLINAIAYKEPTAALEFLDKIADGPQATELLGQGVRSLINGGSQMHRFEELLAKASPKIRPYLLEAGFEYGVGNHDPRQSASTDPSIWLERIKDLPADRRENAISGLARGWARTDPQEALNWAQTLPDSGQREQAVSAAASTWAETDPFEAANWLNSLPKGDGRDNAAFGLVTSLAYTEPESAWNWALSIATEGRRQQALQHAYGGLVRKDPSVAQQLLQGAGLSAAELKLLLQNTAR